MKIYNKNILIVGASQGIGAALALELSKHQNNIAIVSRRLEKLQEIGENIKNNGSKVLCIEADALDSIKAEAVVQEVRNTFQSIDIAFLVVGGSPPVNIAKTKVETIQNIMELNYNTMVNYFKPVLDIMLNQHNGQIVHINSLAAFAVFPKLGPYSAAKTACKAFMDTARAELSHTNIQICNIHPGFIKTEGLGNNLPKGMPVLEVDAAAKKIIHAVSGKKRSYIFPTSLYLLIRLSRILPYFILKSIFKKI
jgi:short-subunit dehydrogenase